MKQSHETVGFIVGLMTVFTILIVAQAIVGAFHG